MVASNMATEIKSMVGIPAAYFLHHENLNVQNQLLKIKAIGCKNANQNV